MTLSERLNYAGDVCYDVASKRTFLTGAFFAAAIAYPLNTELAIGCLGAPALYGALGFTWKAVAKAIDYSVPPAP